ncbi:N-acetyltransferase family protein [Streptococcus constellatus subsp. viborgensis]|uniref:GNAT family N-acetyltransferase n=1 Tax=Streptococcus constellatus TaxID=76860 RepID=UPI0018E18FEF|nr:GNAT family N-acetyltransferase [Streptococcus constellatus]QQC22788.1 GNAT family N-acetyltransferase [Streptococcus constellatus]
MSSNLIPQVTLREASLEDWKAIVAIEEANFSTEAAGAETIQKWIEQEQTNFLIAELNEKIAGYLVGSAVFSRHLTDELFEKVAENPDSGGFIAIQSLSVHPDFKGQGIGTLPLAALKEKAVVQNRQGLNLTCHDYLISYYEMNNFKNEGISDSVHAGVGWYDMVWDNPYFKE